jgi:taurine dioxygenase
LQRISRTNGLNAVPSSLKNRRRRMPASRHNSLEIEPVTGAIGAEIKGLDISEKLSPQAVADLRAALEEHLVIFMRDQQPSPDQLKAFTANFGELHIHPIMVPMPGHPEIIEVIKEPDETSNWGDGWHTDLIALPEPPMGSVLYAIETPPYSGDTHFANMYLAFETLSSTMQNFIEPMVCSHRQELGGFGKPKAMATRSEAEPSSANHPLVRTHPWTGKKSLFLGRPGRTQIIGLSKQESDSLLNFLIEHAANPDFSCRFRWKKNSLAFWDNRCTQHRVTADYFYSQRHFEPHRRHMQRITLIGDRPA